jgi:hypothetical protein
MKKIDKKVKSKQKPKTKTVMKQKQKQNQSVVINISQNKAKTRTPGLGSNGTKLISKANIPRTVKPSYLQSITTYPIFREETAQMPLYRNPEPKKEESVFVDKTTLRTEVPEHDVFKLRSQTSLPTVNNIDIPVAVKSPGNNVSKLISGANLPVAVKTPGNNVSKLISGANLPVAVKTPVKKTESQMIEEYDNLYENVVAKQLDFSSKNLVKPKYPRGMRPPLTQEEIQRKKDELNQKRRTEYAIKKREKSLQ